MTQDTPILQELKELESSLAGTRPESLYRAPAGYFDSIAELIMTRIKALDTEDAREELKSLSPLLANISKEMPYTVPTGYFEELEQTPYASIFAEEDNPEKELEMLSPLLQGLKKEDTYSVPAGYFEGLNNKNTLIKKDAAKVVSFSRPKWIRYAAAAVVVAFISVSGFFFLNKKNQPDPSTSTSSYAWVEKNMKKVDTTDINAFLQLADETIAVAGNPAATEEVKELFKNVSDKDIQEFLNDVGSDDSEDDILN